MAEIDYLIIGAGAAGCTLAARLSEDENTQVTVLEAGGSDKKLIIAMPAAVPFAYMNSKIAWGEQAGPEPHLDNRYIDEKRGHVLGGTTSINAMIFNRGNSRDYDGWEQQGLTGWGYKDVLPYFKKMETFAGGADEWRGGSGPLKISRCHDQHKLYDCFFRGGEQAGEPRASDHNGAEQYGLHTAQTYNNDGVRVSASRSYLRPNEARPNLTVRTGAQVRRILFEKDHAIGAELLTGERIYAAREVIISASAVGTPKLLMLSGVGPADHLREHGIEVIADLPNVGANLENHPGVNIQYSTKYKDSIVSELGPLGRAKLGLNWLYNQQGLGARNFFEVGAFLSTVGDRGWPNVQFEFLPLVRYVENDKLKIAPGFQFWVDLSRPHSRGHVSLTSADPKAHPKIVFNHMAAEQDRLDLVNAIKLARDLIAQPAWDGVRGEEVQPGKSVQCDAELEAWSRQAVGTSYHPSGTCRMSSSAADGVVDGEGRVHGLDAVRVVDASIMPRSVTANLSATVYMMAEKMSDAIRCQ